MVEFERPSSISAETINTIFGTSILNVNTMTLPFNHFTSMEVEGQYSRIMAYFCYGDELMLEIGPVTFPGGVSFGPPAPDKTMVIPFSPVVISEGASSVTLNISWDLNGIVEQWSGKNNTPNDTDDQFVFKKGWWNNLHVTASVQ